MPPRPDVQASGILSVDVSDYRGPEYFGNPREGRLKSMLDEIDKFISDNPNATTKEKVEVIHAQIYKAFGTYAEGIKQYFVGKAAIENKILEIKNEGIDTPWGRLKEDRVIDLKNTIELLRNPDLLTDAASQKIFPVTMDLDFYPQPIISLLSNLTETEQIKISDQYKTLKDKVNQLELAENVESEEYNDTIEALDKLKQGIVNKYVAHYRNELMSKVSQITSTSGSDNSLAKIGLDGLQSLLTQVKTTEDYQEDIRNLYHEKWTNSRSTVSNLLTVGKDDFPTDINSTLEPDTLVCKDYSALFKMLLDHIDIPNLYINDLPGNHAFVFLPEERVVLETTRENFESVWRQIDSTTRIEVANDKFGQLSANVIFNISGKERTYTFTNSDQTSKPDFNPLVGIRVLEWANEVDSLLKSETAKELRRQVSEAQKIDRDKMIEILTGITSSN